MSKKIEMNCYQCGKPFMITACHVRNQVRKGRDPKEFYCSKKCIALGRHGITPFTYTLTEVTKRCRDNSMELGKDVDVHYLEKLWTGRCAITDMEIRIPSGKRNKYDSGSLDRIDSDIGYIRGNLQWLAYPVNLAKQTMSTEMFEEFLDVMIESRLAKKKRLQKERRLIAVTNPVLLPLNPTFQWTDL